MSICSLYTSIKNDRMVYYRNLWVLVCRLFVVCQLFSMYGCMSYASKEKQGEEQTGWESELEATLPLLGHRNWILVVDKAYPAQTAPGVEVIDTGGELPDVLRYTLDRIREARHVTPQVYQDSELQYLNDSMAVGISDFKKRIAEVLDTLPRAALLHDSLLARTTEDGNRYRILVLKTETLLPYTSVFLQLDCGYWGPQQDSILKSNMPVIQAR